MFYILQGGENNDSCSTVKPYRIMVKIGSHVLYEKTLSKMDRIPVPNLSPNTTYEVTVSTLKKDFTTLPLRKKKWYKNATDIVSFNWRLRDRNLVVVWKKNQLWTLSHIIGVFLFFSSILHTIVSKIW